MMSRPKTNKPKPMGNVAKERTTELAEYLGYTLELSNGNTIALLKDGVCVRRTRSYRVAYEYLSEMEKSWEQKYVYEGTELFDKLNDLVLEGKTKVKHNKGAYVVYEGRKYQVCAMKEEFFFMEVDWK